MKALLAFLPLLALSAARSQFNMELEPLSDAMIFYINNVANTTWRAGRNFPENDLARVKGMLGVDMKMHLEYKSPFLKSEQAEPVDVNNLPASFDARAKWPKCAGMKEVRDQSNCGSCWAFGSVEAMSDRICAKYGKNVHLSAADLMECCPSCLGFMSSDGCEGGLPIKAWEYYHKSGIVTGGQFNTSQGCMPYPFPKCDHHTTGKYPPCSGDLRRSPKCSDKCESSYPKSYPQDKHFGNIIEHYTSVSQIMQALVKGGPVTTVFDVYGDFTNYKSGVYQHTTGGYLGGHCVKIIGYGTEGGVDYWLVTNSWNEDWGDKGFFKIKRGDNECNIEINVIASDPKN